MNRNINSDLVFPETNCVPGPITTATALTYCDGTLIEPFYAGNIITFTNPYTVAEGYYIGRTIIITNSPEYGTDPIETNDGTYAITGHTINGGTTSLVLNHAFLDADNTDAPSLIGFDIEISNYTDLQISIDAIQSTLVTTIPYFYLKYDLDVNIYDDFFSQYETYNIMLKGYASLFVTDYELVIADFNRILNLSSEAICDHNDMNLYKAELDALISKSSEINTKIGEYIALIEPLQFRYSITQLYIEGENWEIYYDAASLTDQTEIDRYMGIVGSPVTQAGVDAYNVTKKAELLGILRLISV